jgi:hypothetical protein
MLSKLSIANFKSWRSIPEMRLAPITGLFGANSAGKSSILQFLLLQKQTAESTDRSQVLNFGDDRSLVSLGTFAGVSFGYAGKEPLKWQLQWSLPEALKVEDPEQPPDAAAATLFETDQLALESEVVLEETPEVLSVKRLEYRCAGGGFGMQRKTMRKYDLFSNRAGFAFQRNRGRAWELPPPVKCYGFPDEVHAYFRNASFLKDFQLEYERLMRRLFYLGPLREYPHREYPWSGAEPEDVGTRGELAINAILAATKKGVTITRGKGRKAMSFEENLAEKLKELGLIDHFSVQELSSGSNLYRVWVRKTARSPMVLITDVGFGVSQILPVLVLCYYVPRGSTVLLEQPEIHLHPKVQAGLADIFVDVVRHRDIQIVVESHSEHLLRRLQRRIAEEQLGPADAALYFCDMPDGASRLTGLQVDDYGNIQNWPDQFFGDDFGEMAAMTRAAMDRREKGGK